jgi:regulator of CtrA degradation
LLLPRFETGASGKWLADLPLRARAGTAFGMTHANDHAAAADHGRTAAPPRGHDAVLHRALVAGLYSDALLLSDDARAWFDPAGPVGQWQAGGPSPLAQVTVGCESLRITLRITHALTWLMNERSRIAADGHGAAPAVFAARVPSPDDAARATLPEGALRLVQASERLIDRIQRIVDSAQAVTTAAPPPAVHALLDRLRAEY